MAKLTWAERIKRARAIGKFSVNSKAKAKIWPTCAVGESVRSLSYLSDTPGLHYKRLSEGPNGQALINKGYQFNTAVQAGDIRRAARLLREIQALAAMPCKYSNPALETASGWGR